MPLTPVTQADSEFQHLLAKSPDSALHLFGDSCHRRLRLGVRLQIALICLGPGPPFHFAPGSFYSLFFRLATCVSPLYVWNQLVYRTIAATLSLLIT